MRWPSIKLAAVAPPPTTSSYTPATAAASPTRPRADLKVSIMHAPLWGFPSREETQRPADSRLTAAGSRVVRAGHMHWVSLATDEPTQQIVSRGRAPSSRTAPGPAAESRL